MADSTPVGRVRFRRRLPRLDGTADPKVEEHGLAQFRHREAAVRQRVCDPRRTCGFHFPSDQAVLLHPGELARQDARTDGAEGLAEFLKARRLPKVEESEDVEGPLPENGSRDLHMQSHGSETSWGAFVAARSMRD